MHNDLWRMSATEVAAGIRAGDFKSREVVEDCLQRYEQTHDAINALYEVRADDALRAADAADQAVAQGNALGSLHGVPVTVKGNVDIRGWATVHGSALMQNNVATETSPTVQNWLNAGAIVIGRTNTPEFCCRWDTTNETFGETKNPWNSALTPGGSSGGAAASLAAGVTPLATGTDLGGSLRQPSQSCGTATIRPSLGRVPNYVPSDPEATIGMQLANTEGPMARTVADVRLGLIAMAARDVRDPWWVPAPLDANEQTAKPIAIVIDPMQRGVSDQVAAGVIHAEESLRQAGYQTEHAEPATLADAVEVWKDVVVGEIFLGLEPMVKDECGALLRRAMEHYHLAVPDWAPQKYTIGLTNRRRVLRDWMAFFERYSVLVGPVSTLPPQPRNYDVETPETTATMMEAMRLVVAINALGLPSAVVPVGEQDGLPQAVQIIGAPFADLQCLQVAEAIEREVGTFTPIDPR